jgi:hypothetical protein
VLDGSEFDALRADVNPVTAAQIPDPPTPVLKNYLGVIAAHEVVIDENLAILHAADPERSSKLETSPVTRG